MTKSTIATILGDPPLNTRFLQDEKAVNAWKNFIQAEGLNLNQENQFAKYFELLITWNQEMDLTAITNPVDIIAYHFQDSARIDRFIDFKKINLIADVGSGAGFPGIPLLIKYPHLQAMLIEVSKKRLSFLQKVIDELCLENAILYDSDWRTFLRKTAEPVQLIICRASLHTDELMRMFKPGSPYKHAKLVYWASKDWQIGPIEQPFFVKEVEYSIKNKRRRYIFFALKSQ